jgi:hypothetical protein
VLVRNWDDRLVGNVAASLSVVLTAARFLVVLVTRSGPASATPAVVAVR